MPYSSMVCSREVVSRQFAEQFRAAKHAEDGVGVAYVHGEQHQASTTSPEITGSTRPSSRATRRTPLSSRPAVVPTKDSVAVVMRTRLP